ncbi:MAG TPA: efflux RND transporter periplasmic adaptor subunit [Polyangia bacterium]|nr:efflux RND transporter periplasmic adaptor subunit [Polyangia bacterium]
MATRRTIVAIGFTLLASCRKPPPPPPPAATVVADVVTTRSVPLVKEYLATIDGATTAQIEPQVAGYILAVNYTEGTIVPKGQLLFTIDPRPLAAALEKARGDHASALAQLDKSKADVARYTPLVAQHALSREQLDDAKAAVLQAEGNVVSTAGQLHTAKLNLDWTQVRSPIAGLVGLAQTRVGTLVTANQVLTVVSSVDPIRASFHVSQQEYLKYADVLNRPTAPEYARLRYFELILGNGQPYPERAREVVVNREIDVSTGTLTVEAFFPNPKRILRPGLTGQVRVHVGTDVPTPVVPERAVTELQGQSQVSIIDSDGRVQTRKVKLGGQLEHTFVVESGLVAGERVITEGQQNVMPGAKVNARSAAAPKPSSPLSSAEPPRQPEP